MNITIWIDRALLAGMACGLSACAYDRSLADRNTLGADAAVPTITGQAAEDIPTDVGPSLHSLLRLDWQPMDVLVPVDGTVHGPTWRVDVVASNADDRHRSLYPTLDSAMKLHSSRRGQVIEGVLSPFVMIGNVVALPVMAFVDPPGSVMSPSRTMLYKRSAPGQTLAGPIPAQTDDPHAAHPAAPDDDAHEQ